MCGRYSLTTDTETLAEHFQLPSPIRFQPSYNIAPGQKILNIVELDNGSRKAVNLFWGLVPSWSKDSKNSSHLINARMETIREKPAFRSAFKHRRCLIPADGFYEWARSNGKQAFHIHRNNRQPFAFAGLWEQWQHESETLYSCTIMTTAANELMQPIHERMPVIITPEHYHAWLNKTANADDAYGLLDHQTYYNMVMTPVGGDWVNNPRHDDARCVEPLIIRN